MPKIKTRKGVAKRIRVTRTGKLVRAHAWKSHLLEHKNSKRKRSYRASAGVHASDVKAVRRALGV